MIFDVKEHCPKILTFIFPFKRKSHMSSISIFTFALAALSASNSSSSSSMIAWSSLIFLFCWALTPCSSSKREFKLLSSTSLLQLELTIVNNRVHVYTFFYILISMNGKDNVFIFFYTQPSIS